MALGDGISGLIFEKGGKLSIGRCLLLIMFIASMVKWMMGSDIPTTMANTLMALLAYVLGTKIAGVATEAVTKIKNQVTNIANTVTENTGVGTAEVEPPASMRGDN